MVNFAGTSFANPIGGTDAAQGDRHALRTIADPCSTEEQVLAAVGRLAKEVIEWTDEGGGAGASVPAIGFRRS
jgi:hypothetical protein